MQVITKLTDKITAKVGDITQEKVCAIVNAANSSLLGGGGVDGAIHRAGGSALLEACKEIRNTPYPYGLPTGEAVSTTAGKLPAEYVIHTVGPIYGNCGNACEALLKNCYINSIKEAVVLGCKNIVFPAISTGIYGYPKDEAARIAYSAVQKMLNEYDIQVTFIFHSANSYEAFIASI
ncbi:MAG: O-acetyl-ADP-ribose deacetylase [Campylobacterota bacterium]